MATLWRAIIAVILAISITVPAAFAANDSADTALWVSAANPSIHDNLIGTPGGNYRYYRLAYPGSNATIKIHLNWNPGYQITGPAFGFNLYGPGGLVGQGIRGDDVGDASTMNFTFVSPTPGEYLVQVYNYTNGSSQDYTIDFTGLGAAPAMATNNSTPDQAITEKSQTLNRSGSLVGSSSGAFSFFDLDYPGGEWPMTVSLSYSPVNSLPSEAFGFNVYHNGDLVVRATESSRSGDTGTATATISAITPDKYTLQIVNYAQGVTANYAIGVNGLTGSISEASGNSESNKAIGLNATVTGGHGKLAGSGAGSFGYYSINYQGNNETIAVVLSFTPGLGVAGTGIGFTVYGPDGSVTNSMAGPGRNSDEGVEWAKITSDKAGYYGVQVFNYVPGITSEYTVRVVGLK
jgi:hypothetical protein